MPSVAWSIDASGATSGAEEFARAADTVKRSGLEAAKAVDALRIATSQQGQTGGAERLATSARAAAAATAEWTREQQKQLQTGITLLSTLGGADRAFSQYTNATLRAAMATGDLVDRQQILVQVQERVRQAQSAGRLDQMFSTAAVNARDLRLNMLGLNTSVGEAVRLLGLFGGGGGALANTALQLSGAAQAVSKLSGGFATLGAIGVGLGTAVAGLGLLAVAADKASAKFDELEERARTIGASTGELQALRFAGALEGVHNLETSLERLQRAVAEASDPTILALRKIGLGIQDLAGVGVERKLELIAQGMSQLQDPAQRVAVAFELFGRNISISNLLNQNVEGLRNLTDAARRYGVVMDEDAVKQAAKFHDQLEAGKMIIGAWRDRIELNVIGVLIEAKKAFEAATGAASEFFSSDQDRASLESRRQFTLGLLEAATQGGAAAGGHPGKTAAELREEAAAAEKIAAAREREAEALARSVRSDTERGRELAARLEEQASEAERRAQEKNDRETDAARQSSLRKEQQAAEQRAKVLQEPFVEAARNIQNTLSSAIDDALSGSLESAKDWANQFAGIARKLASELIATRITQPLIQNLFGNLKGFGGTDVNPTTGLPADASRDEVLEILRKQEGSAAQTAQNTGGILQQFGGFTGILQTLGAGAAGVFGGLGIGSSLGLKGGPLGMLGGVLGAGVGGFFGGPVGAAGGGFVGSLISGETLGALGDLLSGKAPSQQSQKNLLTILAGPLGFLRLGGQSTQAAFLTTAGGGPAGDFRSGISAASPFGTVGLAAGRSQSLAADFTRSIVTSLSDFDKQVASLLDRSQIAEVAAKLQQTAGAQQSARDFGEKEISRLFVDRGRTIAEALLAGFKNANVEAILTAQGLVKGATTEQIGQGIQGVSGMIRDVGVGRRELRGEVIADFTTKLESLQEKFRQLAPAVLQLDGNLEGLQADLEAGTAALKQSFLDDLRTKTLALVDPFAAAVDQIAQEEQRLARETTAMGTGIAEAAEFIKRSREDLAKRATQPTQSLLDQLALDRASPAQARNILGERFTTALGGTDAGAVASAASALLQANEKFFGRTSLFFESQTFIERSLEAFNARLREQALAGSTATQTQTDILSANQEEQTDVLRSLLATTQSQSAEITRLRADLTLVLSRLAANG